ncbi:MAG: helix-turn-helix domain-containing protein [Chloroflexi bacterium]|nr:helix-turn-helix domain-containing protein [Chloroflexota bacterium]
MKALLSVEEAAAHTGLAKSTLNKMRGTGRGPSFVRMGRRRIGYRPDDLDAWLDANTHRSTSEYPDDPDTSPME